MCDSFNLRETLNELYNIKPQNIKEIPHGYTNRKYLLTLKNGKKYVARLSPLYREKHIWLESYVLEKLRSYKLGFLVPKVVATLSGEYFRNVGNYILTVFQYIEGSVASELQISPLDKESFSY
ncbi:MAG: phosphotransferase, partial [Candidatus Aenigmatarchaeota archaeon]